MRECLEFKGNETRKMDHDETLGLEAYAKRRKMLETQIFIVNRADVNKIVKK